MNKNISNEQQKKNSSDNREKSLYKTTLLSLAEMLQPLKDGDSNENRQKIKSICEKLSVLGKTAKIAEWVQLTETSTVAIADTNNEYKTTTQLIIRELKEGAEKILNGRSQEVKLSAKLKKLVSESYLRFIDLERIKEEINPPEIGEETISRDFWKETKHKKTELEITNDNQITEEKKQNEINNQDESINDWLTDETNETDENETQFEVSSVFLREQGNITLNKDSEIDDELDKLFSQDSQTEDFLAKDTSLEDDWDLDMMEFEEENSEDDLLDILDDLDDESPNTIGKVIVSKSKITHITQNNLTYEDFNDLENVIDQSPEKSINFDTLSLLMEDLILDYQEFESLDQFIESGINLAYHTTVNWEELSNLIEGIEDKISTNDVEQELSFVINNVSNSPEVSQELSDLDQLLVQARESTQKTAWSGNSNKINNAPTKKVFEQTMRVPVKQLDSLNNLIGEMVVRRNRLEEDQDRLRQFLDNLLGHVQNMTDVGSRMQDLYERSLLEGALIASREKNKATVKSQLERSQKNTKTQLNSSIVGFEGNDNLEKVEHSTPQLDDLELDRFSGFHLLSQEVLELIVRVRESTSDIQFLVDETEQLGRNLRQVTTQLQEEINKSRMISFKETADRLPRAVRDISVFYKKEIELKVEGKEVLIDKMILEHLWDPIQQIVKNSITHGIEIPEIRKERGKPSTGTITIRAFLQGPQTVISISDDGAGIDAEKIKAKAIANQLVTPAVAANLKTQDIYDFLFYAGFSTKEKADSYAGRGVGLDIVRSKLNEIRGTINIDSKMGIGTTFTIRLPLTLTIGKALCCLNDNGRIAFPLDGIEDPKYFNPKDIKTNEQGQKCIPWHGELLPYRSLSSLLTYNRQISRSIIYKSNSEDQVIPILILRGGNNLLAIQVDQVIGEEEIVIKQISGPLPKPKGIAGATVRSDGTIMPIADVIELIDIAQGNIQKEIIRFGEGVSPLGLQAIAPQPKRQIQPLVLIVDDSITVREMLSISFTKAGYIVEQARDGEEAWTKLRSGLACDLVFSDIEMPRMNGLELLEQIEKDDKLSHIPVAILSSRGAEKHQKIAAQLGATAYLIKPYVEKDLIDSAKRMINGEILLAGSSKKPRPKKEEVIHGADNLQTSNDQKKKSNLVLIIDDSVVVREMLSMTFKKAGYKVEQARDGQDAWDKLALGSPYSILLCDIEMPRMNGLELLAKMQQDERLSKIPVAMITSRGAERHRKIAADLGAKAYFTKPYVEQELLLAVKQLIIDRGEIK